MIARFSLLALLGLPLLGAAQSTELARDKSSNFNNGYAMPAADAGLVKGNPFLLPDWVPASLQMAGGGAPRTIPLKYDLYRQELRVKRPQGDSVVVPLLQVKEFSLTSTTPVRRFLCFPPASLPTDVAGGCGEALFDGPHAQVLKFQRKEIVKQAGESGTYASQSTSSALETQTHYYLRWSASGRLVPLKLKRASLEQALAGQPAALAALKARKGSLGTETELAAAVAAIDPLLAAATN
jgi:hypothetical protein